MDSEVLKRTIREVILSCAQLLYLAVIWVLVRRILRPRFR